jgi:hypothetical protein
MNRKSRISIVIGGAVAVAVGGAAVALATFSPVDGNGQINACYAQKNGALRVVTPGAKCAAGETSLLWAQQGVPGPSGPPGVAGPAGPTGPAGSLSCADELRIAAAAPAFALTPSCLPTPSPTPSPSASSALPALGTISPVQGKLVPNSTNVPVATVTLTSPAVGDTTVQVTSSNQGVLMVTATTVASGQTSAQVLGNTLSVGSTVLTATLAGDTRTTSVTVSPLF